MDLDNSIQKALNFLNQKKFNDALNILQDFKHEDHRILFIRGTIYLAQKKMDLAEKNLLASSKINNKNFSTFYNLGIMYDNKGEDKFAIDNFIKAIKINGHLDSMCEIGKIYLRQNNYEEAKKYFEEVLKKDCYNRRANIMFGNLYLKMNDHTRGWDHIYKATGLIRFSDSGVEIVE